MEQSRSISKRICVVASSDELSQTFMGSLIYKTGLEMQVLEELEKAKRTQYSDIVPYMREKHIDTTFYTPKNYCAFVDESDAADTVVYLLDATNAKDDTSKVFQTTAAKKSLQRDGRALVLIDRMQAVNWDESTYKDLVSELSQTIKDVHGANIAALAIPISSTDGDNMIETSKKSTWYSSGDSGPLTVVHAIDGD